MIKNVVSKVEDIVRKIMIKIGEDKFWRYFLILFLILAIIPAFAKGVFWGHDVHFHLSRIQGIVDGIKSGSFPVLVYPGYFSGYGYGNGIFYPDIFLYIPALLNLIGLSSITSYKIFLVMITCATVASMYFSIKKITKSNYTATIISVLYLMSSYRITDMWIRSALGETLTFIFFPFIILGLYELIYGNEKEWKYLTIGLAGVVLSHLISGMFCLLLVAVFGLCNIKKLVREKNRLKYCIIAGLLAIGISAFFAFPLIEAMFSDTFNYSIYNTNNPISEHSVSPLLSIIEVPTGIEPWVPQGIGLVFIYLLWQFGRKNIAEEQSKFKNICLVLGLILLFATTTIFPWNIVGKVLGVIQFPWRLYLIITLLLLFGVAFPITNFTKGKSEKIHLTLILSVFICFTYAVSTLYLIRFGLITDYKRYVVISREYVPVDVNTTLYKERGDTITSNYDVITSFDKNGTSIKIEYSNNNNTDSYLELPLMYYHGYVALENGNHLKVEKGNNGVVRVYLKEKSGIIEVYYGITIVRKIGIICSIICFIIFITLCVKGKKKIES